MYPSAPSFGHELHRAFVDDVPTFAQEALGQRRDDALRVHRKAVAGHQQTVTNVAVDAGKHLAEIVRSEPLGADAVAVTDPLLQRGRLGVRLAFPDLHGAHRPHEVVVRGCTNQLLPAGESVAVHRAHRVGNLQHAVGPTGHHPARQPGRGLRQPGRTHHQRPERIGEPVRHLPDHARHGDRHGGIGTQHAGVAERGTARGSQRIDNHHLLSRHLQVQRRRKPGYAGADDDRVGMCFVAHGFTSKVRGRLVRISGPVSPTSTVSLSDTPAAETYMWNTIPGSSRNDASG